MPEKPFTIYARMDLSQPKEHINYLHASRTTLNLVVLHFLRRLGSYKCYRIPYNKPLNPKYALLTGFGTPYRAEFLLKTTN